MNLCLVAIPVFLDCALQWMLMLPRQIHGLRDFGLSHLVGKNTANADAALVHVQHNLRRILLVFIEKSFEDVDDELHRRVVVVQHQHFVHCRALGFFARLNDNACRLVAVDARRAYGVIFIGHVSSVFQSQLLKVLPII